MKTEKVHILDPEVCRNHNIITLSCAAWNGQEIDEVEQESVPVPVP